MSLILAVKAKARDKDNDYCSIEWFKIIVEFNLEVTNVFEARIYVALKIG